MNKTIEMRLEESEYEDDTPGGVQTDPHASERKTEKSFGIDIPPLEMLKS